MALYVIPELKRDSFKKKNYKEKELTPLKKICYITFEVFVFWLSHSLVKNTGKGAGREALFEQI